MLTSAFCIWPTSSLVDQGAFLIVVGIKRNSCQSVCCEFSGERGQHKVYNKSRLEVCSTRVLTDVRFILAKMSTMVR